MKISTKIFLAFSIVLVLSAVDSVSNYLLSQKVEKNISFLGNSQDIVRNSTRLHKTIIEMQNAFRGFLLTGDADFLDSYNNNLKIIDPLFSEQEKRIVGKAAQTEILQTIEKLHLEWIENANALIVAEQAFDRNSGKPKNPINIRFKNRIGKSLNDEIKDKFAEFDREEYRLRKLHSDNLINSIATTHRISLALFILTTLIGILSTFYIIRMISRRIQRMVNQASAISKGNFTIVPDNEHDELSDLSASLNAMSDILNKNISELEKRNAELDKFSYVVSHDLKAPLRGIHNVVNWIEEDLHSELSPQMKHYLSIIPQRTKRMEDLINGLLDYARIRKKNVAELTDVGQLVQEIRENIVPPEFEFKIDNPPVFTTERLKLEQVFANLISNAVKYAQPTGGKIVVSCSEKGSFYEFSIKDSGVGIAPEFHQKIFELFQTLRDKDEKESTGIGLAIVKKIIDDQHGIITLNSAPGNGAEFIFTWPIK